MGRCTNCDAKVQPSDGQCQSCGEGVDRIKLPPGTRVLLIVAGVAMAYSAAFLITERALRYDCSPMCLVMRPIAAIPYGPTLFSIGSVFLGLYIIAFGAYARVPPENYERMGEVFFWLDR